MILFTCLVFTPESQAEEIVPSADSNIQTMVYEVYAGGIHAVQATLTMDLSKKAHYDLDLAAKTRGFLGKMAPWHGTFESHGWVMDDGSYKPKLHRSTATWKDEEEIKSYNYGQDGSFKSLMIKDHDKPEEKKTVEDELTQGTTDALTATLTVLQMVGQGQACESESEVFDGKRRFKQTFKSSGEADLIANSYNIFTGKTQKCTVEITPVAGKWHKKPRGWLSIQEQGRDKGTMPTVWMGTLKEGSPAVPVKIMVKTQFGALMMHLAEYQSGEKVLVAEKREKD
ncbi:DUF3108 domain-containing protein [Alphaproteobacteria bacterium]|nr:DUF3108 domain-containing protein [Alphaproteobacteria bacterium]